MTGLSSTDVNDVLDAARLFTSSMDTDGEAAGPTQPPATATKVGREGGRRAIASLLLDCISR